MFSKGELLVIVTAAPIGIDNSKQQQTGCTLPNLATDRVVVFHGLQKEVVLIDSSDEIFNKEGLILRDLTNEKGVVETKVLDHTIRNPNGDGLRVLIKDEKGPQALYSSYDGTLEGDYSLAGVLLKMRFDLHFGQNNEIDKKRLKLLPGALRRMANYGSTIITINQNSSDAIKRYDTHQLVAAAAFHHHQKKLSKQS